MRAVLALLPIVACVAACSRFEAWADPAPVSGEIRLQLGEGIPEPGSRRITRLRFASVLEDSRCPPDVKCVWEGNARVLIEIIHRADAPGVKAEWIQPPETPGGKVEFAVEKIELSTNARFEQRRPSSIGTLTLRGIEPLPLVRDPKKYVVTLLVEPAR